MAISRKQARKAAALLLTHPQHKHVHSILERLAKGIKSKGFRRSIGRIQKAMEQPKKAASKKAA